jgi:hypothetical protein
MTKNNPLITITQTIRFGNFKVEPDSMMVLPGSPLAQV